MYQQKKSCERLFTKMLAADISLWKCIKPSFFLKLSALFVFPTASMYCFYSHKNSYLNYEKPNQTHFHQGQYSWLYRLGELLGCYRKAEKYYTSTWCPEKQYSPWFGGLLKKRILFTLCFLFKCSWVYLRNRPRKVLLRWAWGWYGMVVQSGI